jgi:hypothetical protein
MKYLLLLSIGLVSCEKYQKGCILNKTAAFHVNNESADSVKFLLIQGEDTIRQLILPHTKYEYMIKAGIVTRNYTYKGDTLYNKSRDNFKMKRCELDGVLIRD